MLVPALLLAHSFLGLCSECVADWPSGLTPTHWRVVWNRDPATQATISWDTAEAGSRHRVQLRHRATDSTIHVDCQRNGRYTGRSDEPTLHYHHARLTGLAPATEYAVTLESDGHRSPEMIFLTAPADDRPVAILFGGDSRSGIKTRQAMNALLARLVDEQDKAHRPPILALAHGGDFVRDGRLLAQWSQWLSDYQRTCPPAGRLLPIIPARGNHDGGLIFNELFDFPLEHANYYALDITPQIRLITLNTEVSTAGDQQSWLDRQLSRSRPTHRWLVAQYHKPAFPAVKIPSGAFPSWVPLFEKHHVDLVCEADGHCIKRTPPIRNNRIDPTGVVYIGEGGLGVGQRTPKTSRWYLPAGQASTGEGHHVQLLTLEPDRLTIRVVLQNGELFDVHHLAPRDLKELGLVTAPTPSPAVRN